MLGKRVARRQAAVRRIRGAAGPDVGRRERREREQIVVIARDRVGHGDDRPRGAIPFLHQDVRAVVDVPIVADRVGERRRHRGNAVEGVAGGARARAWCLRPAGAVVMKNQGPVDAAVGRATDRPDVIGGGG